MLTAIPLPTSTTLLVTHAPAPAAAAPPVPGHRILVPGHDQRAVHDRITRQWGNTFNFINWFDATYPEATGSEDHGA